MGAAQIKSDNPAISLAISLFLFAFVSQFYQTASIYNGKNPPPKSPNFS